MVLNLGGSIAAENSVTDMGVQPPDERQVDLTEDGINTSEKPKANQGEVTQIEKGLGKLLVKDAQSRYLSEGFWVSVDQVGTALLAPKLPFADI